MRAVTFQAPEQVRIEEKPEPELGRRRRRGRPGRGERRSAAPTCTSTTAGCRSSRASRSATSSSARCWRPGDDVERVAVGDRVLGCFHTACATCSSCLRGDYHRCRNGQTFGHGANLGDLQGAQAEQLLVPRANLTLRRVPEGMSADVALFAGDVMGTGYHAVAHAGMRSGDTVAVLGLGPVGLCAVQAALAGGAVEVFAIDTVAGAAGDGGVLRRDAAAPDRAGAEAGGAGGDRRARRRRRRRRGRRPRRRWRWRSASPATPAPSPGSAPTPARARCRWAWPG